VTGESLALIRSARVVLVTRSTTGIEAMSLGRPVLQVPPRGYVGPTEFIAESGAARRVDSVEELAAAAEHLLSDRSAFGDAIERGRAFAGSFIHGLGEPGGAVRRLEDLVAELRRS
jgi:glycosyltransferase involved in cell wall biosynthesis